MDDAAYSDSEGRASSDPYADTPPSTRDEVVPWQTPTKRKHDAEECLSSAAKRTKYTRHSVDDTTKANVTLPPQLWQRIFSYLDPQTLGRLLRVDRTFNACLSGPESSLRLQAARGATQVIAPELVWTASRRMHYPWLPEPLPGHSDLDMFKLLGRTRCDDCGKLSESTSKPGGGWTKVYPQVVWAFCVRLCTDCLLGQVDDEPTLLFSSFSAVLPLAPFAFLSSEERVIPSASLSTMLPSTADVKKIFFKPMLEDLQSELRIAQLSTQADAQARYRALKKQREDFMQSVNQWERCELRIGARLDERHGIPLEPPLEYHETGRNKIFEAAEPSRLRDDDESPPTTKPWNIEHANEAKAARRSEIERRCMELEPPLSPRLLQHMDSFQASVQISHELTEREWDLLQPRLVEQKHIAELREDERIAAEQFRQSTIDEQKHQDAVLRDIKESSDREWEERQVPVRTKLSEYADEVIANSWADGKAVNYDTSPKFAAEVLLHVRRRFYSDMSKEHNPRHQHHSSSSDFKDEPVRTLVLDHMRWVWHAKIKPLTEQHRKNPFVCSACNDRRYFAFESVIQHYATKHTHTFSAGQVTVQWRTAEWPESPPFAPDPSNRAAYQHSRGHSSSHVSHLVENPAGLPPRPTYVPAAGNSVPVLSPGPMNNPGLVSGYGAYHAPFATPPTLSGYPVAHSPFHIQPQFPVPPSPVPPPGNWPHPAYVPAFSPNAYRSSPFSPPGSKSTQNLYQAHLDVVAHMALETWSLISGHRRIPPSVKIYVVIYHVISHFRARFSNEPSLDLFSNFLDNHPLISSSQHASSLKNATGLACKTCVLRNEDLEESHSSFSRLNHGERKLYPFYSLLQHFKNVHVENPTVLGDGDQDTRSPERLDWKHDMIELPEPNLIKELAHLPDMDDTKLRLIAVAFPDLFKSQGSDSFASIVPVTVRESILVKGEEGRFQSASPNSQSNATRNDQDRRATRHHPKRSDAEPREHLGDAIRGPLQDDVASGITSRQVCTSSKGLYLKSVSADQYAQTSRSSVYRDLGSNSITDPYRQPSGRVDSPSSYERPTKYPATATRHSEATRYIIAGPSTHGERSPSVRSVRSDNHFKETGRGAPDPATKDKSAAERFLSEFVPGQDGAEYETKPSGQDRRNGRDFAARHEKMHGQFGEPRRYEISYEAEDVNFRNPLEVYDQGSQSYQDALQSRRDYARHWQPLETIPGENFDTSDLAPLRVQPAYYYREVGLASSGLAVPAGRYVYDGEPSDAGIEYIPVRPYDPALLTRHRQNLDPNDPQHPRPYRD